MLITLLRRSNIGATAKRCSTRSSGYRRFQTDHGAEEVCQGVGWRRDREPGCAAAVSSTSSVACSSGARSSVLVPPIAPFMTAGALTTR